MSSRVQQPSPTELLLIGQQPSTEKLRGSGDEATQAGTLDALQ
jgi:hypothetical protein